MPNGTNPPFPPPFPAETEPLGFKELAGVAPLTFPAPAAAGFELELLSVFPAELPATLLPPLAAPSRAGAVLAGLAITVVLIRLMEPMLLGGKRGTGLFA